MTGTVSVCPWGVFRRCYSFVKLIGDLRMLEHLASILVGITFEVPYLYIELLHQAVRNGVY